MKKIALYLLIAAGVLSSCSKSELVELKSDRTAADGELVFVASADRTADTKTALDGMNINWVAADPVMIFGKDGESNPKVSGYAAHAAGASTTLDWTTNISGTEGAFVTGETPEYALYPTDAENASIDGSVITFKLPKTQTYAAGSFGQNANVAVGKITSLEGMADIKFKNVCGYLKLQVSVPEGDAATVGRIVLTTKGTEKLWGTFTADAAEESPVATYKAGATDGSTSVTLNCPDGVAVSTDASNPTVFYIVVPDGALASGFTAEVYSKQDHLMTTLETSNAVTIERNHVNRMANKSFNWIPAAYAEQAYIQSNGGQGIDTGYQCGGGFRFVFATEALENPKGGGADFLCGVYYNSSSYQFTSLTYAGAGYQIYFHFNNTRSDTVISGEGIRIIDVCTIANNRYCHVSGDSIRYAGDQTSACTRSNNYVGFICGIGENRHVNRAKTSAKWFYCDMYDASNSLIRQFIPAYLSAGEEGHKYGMYDVLNDVFYTNAYTGQTACDFNGGSAI